nr:hypothetical protein Iba_chr14aCG17520 [Ipomoea batatas]
MRLCSEAGQSVNAETKARKRKRKRAFLRGANCRFLISGQRLGILKFELKGFQANSVVVRRWIGTKGWRSRG